MIARVLAGVFGSQNERTLKRLQPLVERINSLEASVVKLTNEELGAKTNEFRAQIAKGRHLDEILPEAFAVVREAARRTLGERHYDVQLIGGIALHQGRIAEMKTGEGKTLVATLPLYLNALSGKGAHLVTVNDYLARRDATWMSPIYHLLGLSVGILQNEMEDEDRQKAYNCDILYATNNELGFDYLRDNMKFRLADYVQRDLNYAIVDEVDSILIDEARTPLIISGSAEESSKLYEETDRIVRNFVKGTDFEVEEKDRQVFLTETGIDKVEHAFNIQNLYAVTNMKLLHHVNQALKAYALFRKDVDYVVTDDQVLIVDEFTGRILIGRRYSDGLHQALEAKEHVTIQQETQTLASITLQNYFRLYKKLAGMTGTAATEAEEFFRIYKLEVLSIPPNKPIVRVDQPDFIFLNKRGKFKSIVTDVKARHAKKQPVLIGTVAIETSEELSRHLVAAGIPHEVLNAKQHAREAEIVAHAGEPGRVTIATNMAGRGTDIRLTPDSKSFGGLYILGTERHESRRIDNQLRGRSGRQGDPGESRFYLSLEDELIHRFAGEKLQRQMKFVGMTEDEVIESKWVSRTIERAQEMVEKRNFDVRKNVLEYDDVLNQQRIVVYAYRRSVLEAKGNITDIVRDQIADCVAQVIAVHTVQRTLNAEVFNDIVVALAQLMNIGQDELLNQSFNTKSTEQLKKDLTAYLTMRFDLYLTSLRGDGSPEDKTIRHELMCDAQKWLFLETIDQAWKQHMLNLDHLKEGIGLRGMMGQKNPLIEYKREAFAMFDDTMQSVRSELLHRIFHLDIEHFNRAAIETRRLRELAEMRMSGIPEATEGGGEQPHLSRAERRRMKKR